MKKNFRITRWDEWEYSIDLEYVEETCVASLRLSDKCSANFNKPRGSSFAMQIYRVSQNKIRQVCKYASIRMKFI